MSHRRYLNGMTQSKEKAVHLAKEFCKFDDGSPSPYHAVATTSSMLEDAGFEKIRETDNWSAKLKAGGKYYFTREGSSLVAFALDENFNSSQELSCAIVSAHTDSPCFKLKPVSELSKFGYLQVGVECYGGGLWHTWFDRDLTVAGRVAVRLQSTDTLEMRLVHIKRPIMRIPTLAIHLDRSVSTNGFLPNKEHHTAPILATEIAANLNAAPRSVKDDKNPTLAESRCSPILLSLLAEELRCDPSDIVDLDLSVSDTQPSAIGGALNEFVFAPRLDNLGSVFTATKALINSMDETADVDVTTSIVRMVAFFDHEEVGSDSSHGAASPMVQETMERVTSACENNCSYYKVVRSSMMISADMAHAIHPNYATMHEMSHRPMLNGGLVVKTNQNQRYATSGITGLILRECSRRAGNLPVQEFVVPNDKPCGSTIGPIISTITGLRTIDVGQSMLSMHSVREVTGVYDFHTSEAMFRAFFMHFNAVDKEISGSSE